ncbi:MAG: FAD-dependent oxidoreductase [Eggerthellaceae bacterium]|nr:FAD-dependent oxidoreductase [Eggerthellaceae bacterium]
MNDKFTLAGQLSRRGFITAAAAAAGVSVAALAGCTSPASGGTDAAGASVSYLPDTWDQEFDIVVVGYGGAGASAAIEAAKAGSTVGVLEKAPEGNEGGNTSVAGGAWMTPVTGNSDGLFDFIKYQMTATVADEEIKAFCDELRGTSDWVTALGGKVALSPSPGMGYPSYPGADAVAGLSRVGAGHDLFALLKSNLEGLDGVTILYETPAKKLIFNPQTKEVFGVVATQAGKDINVKAKKAVILALGGYEHNPDIMTQFVFPHVDIYQWGTPYNTGDGLAMVMEIGAAVRHFWSIEWGSFCVKQASIKAGNTAAAFVYPTPQFDNAILVNSKGVRFQNEIQPSTGGGFPTPTHDKGQLPVLSFDSVMGVYRNLPFYMVFDETKRAAGPIPGMAAPGAVQSWLGIHQDVYSWSADNKAEIASGVILQADTLEELADKAGIDRAALADTVAKWNAACAAGADGEFGREKQLTPIETAPFYLTEMALSIINTQGGANRDGSHHVLDWDGNPIPRLYAGGEFGSIYGFLYQGAGNIPEALGNRMSGINAAAETPWE